jgi:prepilin-type N-terminal cleavage/methylation domain-containing protein
MNKMPRTHGFTLLELLVVIAIIGVVMTIGTSTFVAVTSAWHERRALTELDNQAQTVFDSIGEDIAATISYDVSAVGISGASREVKDDRTYPAATHADDEICLPANVFDTARNQTTPSKVAYRVDRANGTTGTITRTAGPLAGDTPTGSRLDLIPARVQGFSVEYLGNDADVAWQDDWAGPGLPRAVRVSISLEDPVRPEFQVARKAVFPIHVR